MGHPTADIQDLANGCCNQYQWAQYKTTMGAAEGYRTGGGGHYVSALAPLCPAIACWPDVCFVFVFLVLYIISWLLFIYYIYIYYIYALRFKV